MKPRTTITTILAALILALPAVAAAECMPGQTPAPYTPPTTADKVNADHTISFAWANHLGSDPNVLSMQFFSLFRSVLVNGKPYAFGEELVHEQLAPTVTKAIYGPEAPGTYTATLSQGWASNCWQWEPSVDAFPQVTVPLSPSLKVRN